MYYSKVKLPSLSLLYSKMTTLWQYRGFIYELIQYKPNIELPINNVYPFKKIQSKNTTTILRRNDGELKLCYTHFTIISLAYFHCPLFFSA